MTIFSIQKINFSNHSNESLRMKNPSAKSLVFVKSLSKINNRNIHPNIEKKKKKKSPVIPHHGMPSQLQFSLFAFPNTSH